MRLVSAMVLRTSASCSSVVIPGLSERKSLPCFIARTAIPARSLAICEVRTSCTEGSSRISSCVLDDLHIGKALAECRKLVVLAAPRRHQFAAAALHGADHAVDVVVAHAADGKLDVILRAPLRPARAVTASSTMRAAPPPKAIALSGSPAIIAADPSDPPARLLQKLAPLR